jgi:streptomycin 6-kinase
VSEPPLPSNLVGGVAADPDPRRHAWLERLPDMIDSLARQWELELGSPFQPGGSCSWVAPAHTVTGEPLVLKVGWLHPEAVQEAQALRLWDGNGAVRLHAEETLADTVALLLERCEPGTPLTRLPEPDQDDVVCAVLPRLWREPPAGHEFRSLQAMCNQWADEFEAVARVRTIGAKPAGAGRVRAGRVRAGRVRAGRGRADLASAGAAPLDPGIARAGIELFRSLPASADRQVVLATDLHAQNILAARREPWLAIDPKPHVGDPAYDPLQHMINCDRVLTDPVGLARRLADLLELDAQRLLLWLFARCVQESPGSPQLTDVAARLAR